MISAGTSSTVLATLSRSCAPYSSPLSRNWLAADEIASSKSECHIPSTHNFPSSLIYVHIVALPPCSLEVVEAVALQPEPRTSGESFATILQHHLRLLQ